MIVVLDNIRSVHNTASIFRTADAVKAEKIFLCGITPTPFNRIGKKRNDFTKVSLGAEDLVLWEKFEETAEAMMKLKRDGFKIFALEQSPASKNYSEELRADFDFKKSALVVGNEVQGISEEVLKMVDVVLEIPMAGKKESLNVAVAFGIAVFEMKRQ